MLDLICSILSCGNAVINTADPLSKRENCLPILWLTIEFLILGLDIANLVLDVFLIKGIFQDDTQDDIYAIILSVAVGLALYGELVTKRLTYTIKEKWNDTTNYLIMMYLGALAIYAIEDVTVIYLFWKIDGIYDPSDPADVLNIFTSVISGASAIVGLFLTYAFSACCCKPIGSAEGGIECCHAYCRNLILFVCIGVVMAIPVEAGISYIILGNDVPEERNGEGITSIFFAISVFFGIILLIVLSVLLCVSCGAEPPEDMPKHSNMPGVGYEDYKDHVFPEVNTETEGVPEEEFDVMERGDSRA